VERLASEVTALFPAWFYGGTEVPPLRIAGFPARESLEREQIQNKKIRQVF
jgi:hypothetical protein